MADEVGEGHLESPYEPGIEYDDQEGGGSNVVVELPVEHAQPTEKRKSTSVAAPLGMASLQNVRREASKKKPKRLTTNATTVGTQQPMYVIDRIIGGSKLEASGDPSHRIEWEGYDDITWQVLDQPIVSHDEDHLGFQVEVVPMGSAARVLDHGIRHTRRSLSMVVGDLVDDGSGDAVRFCYEGGFVLSITPEVFLTLFLCMTTRLTLQRYPGCGAVHKLDMLRCTCDDQPMDWIMSTVREVLHTDAVIDWASDGGLTEARDEWDGGKFYPRLGAVRCVLLYFGQTVMPSLPQISPKLQHMCLELVVFLTRPESAQLPIVVGHARSLRDIFMEGSFIRDCLTSLASLEHVTELSKLAAEPLV